MPFDGVTVIVEYDCIDGEGVITAAVTTTRAENIWVVATDTATSQVFISTSPVAANAYTFILNNVPNGYYQITPYGSISGAGQTPRYAAINCLAPNTGNKVFRNLEEYFTDTGLPTGNQKPNTPGDPDYIAPTPDTTMCPI